MADIEQRPDGDWLPASKPECEALMVQRRGSSARLSRAQKWDLVRISAAAVASLAFFATPALLPPLTPAVPAGPVLEAQATARVSVVTTEIAVPVIAVSQSTPVPGRSVPPGYKARARRVAQPRARLAETPAPVVASAAGFAQKLGRAIAGDGRYSVRPFPTVEPR